MSTSKQPVEPQSEPSARTLLDHAKAAEQNSPAEARILAQQARIVACSTNDKGLEAEANYRLASLSYYLNRADETYRLAVDARDIAHSCHATQIEAWAYNLIALVHYEAGNYGEALESSLLCLKLSRGFEHLPGFGTALNTLAIIHHSLGDLDRALESYEAALDTNKPHHQAEFDVLTLSNLARLRRERNEFLIAVSIGESALQLSADNAPGFLSIILADLGASYAALGDEVKANECFDEALQTLKQQELSGIAIPTTQIIMVHANRGVVAVARGHDQDGERDFREVLRLAQENGLAHSEIEAHEALSKICRRLGRFEEALDHQEARFAVNNSLFNQGADLRIKTLQIAHDTERSRQQAEILRLRTTELEDLVRVRIQDSEHYQIETFQRLAALAELRSSATSTHTEFVGDLAAEIAHELQEDVVWCENLRLAARLHDIGKISTPDAILLKPDRLTDDERAIMMTHSAAGAQVLAGSSSPVIRLAEAVALSHHERWDGAGYPLGLAGLEIPRSGRIVSVADVYDALTRSQPYKDAWTAAEAVKHIIDDRGSRFEPEIVDAFLRVIVRREPELQYSASVPIRQRHAS